MKMRIKLPVMKVFERGTFFQLKICERDNFSAKKNGTPKGKVEETPRTKNFVENPPAGPKSQQTRHLAIFHTFKLK